MFIYVWLGKNPWALKVGKREFAKAADFMYLDILLTSKKGLKKIIINQFFKAYFEIITKMKHSGKLGQEN